MKKSLYILMDGQTESPYFINRNKVSFTDYELTQNKITLWRLFDTVDAIDSKRIMCVDKVFGADEYIPVHKNDDPGGYMLSID